MAYKPIGAIATFLTLQNTIVAGNGPHECYTRNGVTTSASVGNLVTDNTANIRNDPPCTGVAVTADPQLGSLQLNPPGRTPTFAIPGTSPAVDAADEGTSLRIDPRLLLAAQTAGGALGSMIAPAKLIVGCSTVGLKGREGDVLRRTLFYGLGSGLLLGGLALLFSQ